MDTEDGLGIFSYFPVQGSVESQQLVAKFSLFDFESSVFLQSYVWLNCPLQGRVVVDVLRNVDSQKEVIIFIMF